FSHRTILDDLSYLGQPLEKILGIQKLAIFKRELFIHLAHYLGWNLYIPSLFIKKHCIKKHMQVAY
ncbi:hypothetical protein, partial [Morganella morganii]|uniref:hypothetical protein n=1 Tax=Morganella morganii TaxID=582 RepID=UPI003EC61551